MIALGVLGVVAVILAATVVVDTLRLHAGILRRLHQLDPDGGSEWDGSPPSDGL